MASTEMEIDSGPADAEAPAKNPEQSTHEKTDAVRSIEGWIIIATNLHEEATNDDVTDFFNDFGTVRNTHLNLDRRSGYCKGYVLLEYATLEEARRAINGANNVKMLGQTLSVDFAFVRPEERASGRASGRAGRNARARSRSPGRDVDD